MIPLWMSPTQHLENPPKSPFSKGGFSFVSVHPSTSQRLSLRGRSPSLRAGGLSEPEAGAEPEPAAPFTLPLPSSRRAGLRAGRHQGGGTLFIEGEVKDK